MFSLAINTITTLSLVSVYLMTYSHEQQLRKAWITKHGSPAGYHKATQQEKEELLNETNNY